MIVKTQRDIFAVMASTGANWLIYFLKRIPFVGKIIPDRIYGNLPLKKILAVVAAIVKMIGAFIKKAFYIGFMIILPIVLLQKGASPSSRNACYIYLFFILSLVCGSFQTSEIFKAGRDKFICIRLMRMDARSYIVSTVVFRNLTDILFFLPSLVLSSALMGGSALQGLLLTVLLCASRFMGEALHLLIYDKTRLIASGKTSFIIPFDLICLAAAYLPVMLHRPLLSGGALTHPATLTVCAALGAAGILFITRYPRYHEIAVATLKSADFSKDTSQLIAQARFSDVAVREKEFKASDLKKDKYAARKGFDYLNAIFFARHRRLLVRPILIRLAVIAVVFVATIAAPHFIPGFVKPLSNPGKILPGFVFVMYFTSIGERVCKAMFYNCDISLLRYSFYREKNAILSNFKVRLLRVAGMNMIIAFAISLAAVGLVLIFHLSWSTLDMLSFALTIMLLSLFFSVHHLFLYYVFQPYTTELGMKNPFYNIIHYGVYFLCWICVNIKSPPSYFSLIVLASTLVYIVAALILVYRYAPKTFRVK